MRLQLKRMIGVLGLAAAAAMLVAAMGATSANAAAGFKTASGKFPVEFLGEGLGKSTFLSSGLNFVSCENSHSKGSVLSGTLAEVTITYLTNCVTGGLSAGTCPTITTNALLLTPLSNLNGGTKLGLLVLPKAGNELAAFKCSTGLGELSVKVKGAVVCESTPGGKLVTAGQVNCRAGAKHGEQQFSNGTDPTGKVVGGTLVAESNLGFFKLTESDSQETFEDVSYKEGVEQTH